MISKKLVSLRKEKGFSQEEVANRLKVSRQTISNWENNQALPTIDKAKELSELYNISIDELLDNKLVNKEYKIGSNTEKLAHIIIVMFKIIGIVIVLCLFIMFLVVLINNRNENKERKYRSFTMNCYKGEEEYYVYYSESKRGVSNYGCKKEECDSKTLNEFSNILYTNSTFNEKKDYIIIYFINNNGYCDEI